MKIIPVLLSTIVLLNASEALNNLTLEHALEIVRSQNLEVKAAQYDIEGAHATAEEASSNNWGSLDFIQNLARSNDAGNVFGFKLTGREATFGDFGAEEFMNNAGACQGGDMTACYNMYNKPPDNLNHPGSRNFNQSKLQYTLPIYVGGKIAAYTDAAREMEKLKKLDKSKLLSAKIYETRKAYCDMALLREARTHLRRISENIETLENMTKSMIKEGYAKKTDLLEVQAKKSNVDRALHQMRANEDLMYHFLSFLLNQKVESIITTDKEVEMPAISDEEIIAQNIDIKRAKSGLEIRRNMHKAEKSGYLPIIGLQANVQTSAESIGDYDVDNGSYTVGLQLKWNLFNGGADSNRIQRAKIEEMKTRTQVELAEKGIALQINKTRTEISSLDYEIASLQKELDLANEIYNSYEERYREQLASMSDVIIKQSEQIQKILSLLEVKNKRTERVFALEKLANGVENEY
jgi:outer membrane protein TolC